MEEEEEKTGEREVILCFEEVDVDAGQRSESVVVNHFHVGILKCNLSSSRSNHNCFYV